MADISVRDVTYLVSDDWQRADALFVGDQDTNLIQQRIDQVKATGQAAYVRGKRSAVGDVEVNIADLVNPRLTPDPGA